MTLIRRNEIAIRRFRSIETDRIGWVGIEIGAHAHAIADVNGLQPVLNTLVSGPEYVFKNSNESPFFRDYVNAYKSEPNFDAAFAYTVLETIGNNITKENLKSPIKNLFSNKIIKSEILGDYTFDNVGNMIVKTSIGVYKNGRIIEVK